MALGDDEDGLDQLLGIHGGNCICAMRGLEVHEYIVIYSRGKRRSQLCLPLVVEHETGRVRGVKFQHLQIVWISLVLRNRGMALL